MSCGKSSEIGKTVSDKALNPAPLGLEIHYANINGVKEKYNNVHFVKSNELDQYTGGVVLTASGAGFNVTGLKSATFIFSKEGVLEHLGLVMNKDVVAMEQNLSAKYQVISKNIDTFMGYGQAQYQAGDTVIKLIGDHLAFNMLVLYTYKPLFDKSQQEAAEQETKSAKEQNSKF